MVKLDGGSVGTTATTVTPAYSNSKHTITINGSTPYPFTFLQTGDGAHQVFYNQPIDVIGKIGSIPASASAASVQKQRLLAARSPAARFIAAKRLPANAIRRAIRTTRGRALYSATRLEVVYSVAPFSTARTFAKVEAAHGGVRAVTLRQTPTTVSRVVDVATSSSVQATMRALRAERGVLSVARVQLRYPLSTTPVTPNDPNYTSQWYLDKLDMSDAWGYGLGSSSVKVAIIDTGYDPNQPEVAPSVASEARVLGGVITRGTGAATDTDGHGTYVSGIVAAQTNNSAGFAGITYVNAPSLLEYKIYPDGPSNTLAAETTDEAAAIYDAVGNGAKIVLLAFGSPSVSGGPNSPGPDPAEDAAVTYAIAHGVAVVAAAGNESATALDFPAAYDGVISVGASALNDAGSPDNLVGATEFIPAYSNSGPGLTLVAPGGQSSGTGDGDKLHFITNSYTTQPYPGDPVCQPGPVSLCALSTTGTSPASAMVAGAAALVLARNSTLGPAQVRSLLAGSADDIGDARQGAGRLNVHRALVDLLGDTTPTPPVPGAQARNFIAFAYATGGGTRPQIANITYPQGIAVNTDGTFRLADLSVAFVGKAYRIAVWYDRNGNGVVDAGDYFGSVACPVTAPLAPCKAAASIPVAVVGSGFTLP